jgi:hypothetical protein
MSKILPVITKTTSTEATATSMPRQSNRSFTDPSEPGFRLGKGWYRPGDKLIWGSSDMEKWFREFGSDVNDAEKHQHADDQNSNSSISDFDRRKRDRDITIDHFIKMFRPDIRHQYIAFTIHLKPCPRIAASKTLRHLLNRINATILKSRHRHMDEFLGCLPILEGTRKESLHYHGLLQTPPGKERAVEKAIFRAWASIVSRAGFHFRRDPPDVDLHADQGWIGYMMKLRTKSDLFDAIDWLNVYPPIQFPEEE